MSPCGRGVGFGLVLCGLGLVWFWDVTLTSRRPEVLENERKIDGATGAVAVRARFRNRLFGGLQRHRAKLYVRCKWQPLGLAELKTKSSKNEFTERVINGKNDDGAKRGEKKNTAGGLSLEDEDVPKAARPLPSAPQQGSSTSSLFDLGPPPPPPRTDSFPRSLSAVAAVVSTLKKAASSAVIPRGPRAFLRVCINSVNWDGNGLA